MILNDIKLYENVIQPQKDSRLWRYMGLEKFLNLIITRKLFFSRLDKFSDQLEGTMPVNNKASIAEDIRKSFLESTSFPTNFSDREEIIVNTYRAFTLANCWSENNAESLALWKIYLDGTKYGVAIQTTYKRLRNSIATSSVDVLFGKVQYVDELESIQQQTISLRKTEPYIFENEVRAVIFNQHTKEGPREGFPKYKYGLAIDVNIELLIEKIYLSPLCPRWYENSISDILQKYDYDFTLIPSAIKEKL